MLIANSKPPATGLAKKMVAAAAIVLGAGLVAAAPALANPEPSDTHPTNPFGGLSCTCQETTPEANTSRSSELERGIMAGLHGRALSTQPTQ